MNASPGSFPLYLLFNIYQLLSPHVDLCLIHQDRCALLDARPGGQGKNVAVEPLMVVGNNLATVSFMIFS